MTRRKRIKKSEAGFTLIELLVVVSVITLLSTVVATNLSGAKAKALRHAALQSLNNAYTAAILCYEDGKELNSGGSGEALCDDIIGGDFFMGAAGTEICDGSVSVWPDLVQFGYAYQICAASQTANSFVLLTASLAAGVDIYCSYNWEGSKQYATQGRCEFRE